jgi:hypothetical protein
MKPKEMKREQRETHEQDSTQSFEPQINADARAHSPMSEVLKSQN